MLEALEGRVTPAAVPLATVTPPADPLIGESFTMSVTFDNAAMAPGNVGYGPYVDLFLDTTGADGAGPAVDDGITFLSATYLGVSLTTIPLTFDSAGQAVHPYAKTMSGAPVVVTAPPGYGPGDTLVVIQLPYGSFVPDQPAVNIQVTAMLSNQADLGTPLNVAAQGGFRFGSDPLDNPTADPSIPGARDDKTVSPALLRLTKTYIGPENETATGPNFPRQYRITVDIADGQTVTNLDLTDVLPNNLQFVQVDSTAIRGTPTATTAVSTPDAITPIPGGTLTRRFASVMGTTATDDATMLFTYYVPLNDAGTPAMPPMPAIPPMPVINATTGDDATAIDDARTQGNWTPLDGRDPPTVAVSDAFTNDHTLTPKSIAIQKSVAVVTDTGAAGPSPGDTLEYTLNFQVSDYFAFENVVVTDLFSDGQRFDATFAPTLSVLEHNNTSSGVFNGSNFTVFGNFLPDPAPNDGTTTVTFDVSQELMTRLLDGQLVGGAIPDGGTGGPPPQSAPPLPFGQTRGTIVFRTVIQDQFSDTFPSGDPSVDQGDTLTNNVTIAGDLLSVADLTANGQSEADTSAASVVIVQGKLTKSIYSINGMAGSFPSGVQVRPGDTVTYRLTYTLPTTDFEQLSLTDYLPLPVFDATTVTTFDPTVSATAPPTGVAKFGPGDTFYNYTLGTNPPNGIVPTLTTDGTANSLRLFYGDYDDPLSQQHVIDILFTVTVSGDPFADGLFLTNQVRSEEGTTFQKIVTADAITQIQLTEPVLNIKKGVVATDASAPTFNPVTVGPVTFSAPGTAGYRGSNTIHSTNLAATPINSNLSNIDAGDLVTFAIIVENTGSGLNGAFDVRIRDTLPSGFVIPGGGLNLNVSDGTGAMMGFTDIGTGLFDPTGGIDITDPGATNPDPGSLDRFDPTNGRNILVITYDLQATAGVQPNQTLTNTATLFNFAGLENGTNHIPTPLTDPATVTVRNFGATKSIVATSEASTSESGDGSAANPRAATIGEIVRYRLVVDLPEGTSPNFQVRDNLPAGMIFLDDNTAQVALVSNQLPITSTNPPAATLALALGSGPFGTDPWVSGSSGAVSPAFVLPDANVGSSNSLTADPDSYSTSGTDVFFKLGDLVNGDRDTDREYVVIEFNALVDNTGTMASDSNDLGDVLNNNFQVFHSGTSRVTSGTVRVRVQEPTVGVMKDVSPTFGDAGDIVTFTVTFTAGSATNNTTAFDVRMTDMLPTLLNLQGISSVTPFGTVTGLTSGTAGNSVVVAADSMAPGSSVTVEYTAQITSNVLPGQVLTNTANVTYTSLPGMFGTTSNPTGSAVNSVPGFGTPGSGTGERTGSGVTPNDYLTSDPADVIVNPIAPVKSLVATSEASTLGNNVTVGEIVRYRIEVMIPESDALTNFQIVDALPVGLTFLNDDTAMVALVSNNNGITSSTLSGAGLLMSGNQASLATITPTFVLPASAISGAPFDSGTDVTFSLGDLNNMDRDADQEFVVIEFNALVDNAGTTPADSNDAGDMLTNTFTVRVNNAPTGLPSNGVTVTVVEPELQLTKQILDTNGNVVTYEVVLTNTGTATAFDAIVRDVLPADLNLRVPTITITPTGGATTGTANHNNAQNRMEFNSLTIPAGDSVTVTYKARVLNPGMTITNTATTTYTSLPGTNGTTPNPTGSTTMGTPGSSLGERDGSNVRVNDYLDTGSASLGSLGDRVWYDLDGNGMQDAGEPGIPGATVTLRWFGPDGIEGNGDDSIITTTTGTDGIYQFDALPLGTGATNYRVTVDPGTLPAGLTSPTYDLDGIGTAHNAGVALSAGNANPRDVDFGYRGTGSLGDRLWLDANGDNLQGPPATEPGLQGVQVTLTWAGPNGVFGDGDDFTYPTTTTGPNGIYGFGNLPAGNFQVTVNGATLPLPNLTPSFDLDGNGTPNTAVASLTPGQTRLDVDFAYRTLGTPFFKITGGPGYLGDTGTTQLGFRCGPITFMVSGVADPATPIPGTFYYQFDWDGNGTVDEVVPGSSTGVMLDHGFPAGTFHPMVRVVDSVGTVAPPGWVELSVGSTTVTVYTAIATGGTIYIGGTDNGDNIVVNTTNPNKVLVRINNVTIPNPDGGNWVVNQGNSPGVVVYGCEGDDVIQTPGYVKAEVHGGLGNDNIQGSSVDDVLYGDEGNDYLTGGVGNDVLVGGTGKDYIQGGTGNDMLIGGDVVDAVFRSYQALRDMGDAWAGSGATDPTDLLRPGVIDDANLAVEVDRLIGGGQRDGLLGRQPKTGAGSDIFSDLSARDGDEAFYVV